MMDAANYAKALKKADDKTIVETQLTKDGEEDFGYGGGRGMGGDQQQQQQQEQTGEQGQKQDNKNARVSAGNVSWSRDSKKFALVRRDSRKVEKLWVINSLASPRPTLETYRIRHAGRREYPAVAARNLRRGRQGPQDLQGRRLQRPIDSDRSGAALRHACAKSTRRPKPSGPAPAPTSSTSRA